MSIPLGIGTAVWSNRFTEREAALLPKLRAWGYAAVELTVADFALFDAGLARRSAADNGLVLTLAAAPPGELRLADEDANVRRRTREWIARALDRSAECGAYLLTGPLVGGAQAQARTEAEWARAVEGLQLIGRMLEGVNARLAIAPLNRYETNFLNTAAEARALCDAAASPKIGALFASFHANIEERSMDAALDALGPRLFHVHLGESTRGVPGSGHVDFAAIAASLKRRNFRGVAIVDGGAPPATNDDAAGDQFAQRAAMHLLPLLAV